MLRRTSTPPTAATTGHGERSRTNARTTRRNTSHPPSTSAMCVHDRNEVCTARVATSRPPGMMISNQRSSGSIPSVDSRARHGRVAASHAARAAAAPGRRTRRVRADSIPITTHATASTRRARASHAIATSRSKPAAPCSTRIRAAGSALVARTSGTTAAMLAPSASRSAAATTARMVRRTADLIPSRSREPTHAMRVPGGRVRDGVRVRDPPHHRRAPASTT